jgi:hypothetical protein
VSATTQIKPIRRRLRDEELDDVPVKFIRRKPGAEA